MAPAERAVASMLVSDTRATTTREEQPERFETMVQDTIARITVGGGRTRTGGRFGEAA